MQVKNPLDGVPRQITGALGDIRKIAEGMQTLPELLKTLKAIEERTASMDEEVKLMRAAVDRLNGGVEEMHSAIEPLEGKLDEVASALHPVRRAFGRRSSD